MSLDVVQCDSHCDSKGPVLAGIEGVQLTDLPWGVDVNKALRVLLARPTVGKVRHMLVLPKVILLCVECRAVLSSSFVVVAVSE